MDKLNYYKFEKSDISCEYSKIRSDLMCDMHLFELLKTDNSFMDSITEIYNRYQVESQL